MNDGRARDPMIAATPRPDAAGASRWLVGIRTTERPRLRIVACPAAGGHPGSFRPWRTLLDGDVELLALHSPGRLGRLDEAPLGCLRDIAAALRAALPQDGVPLALLGHSFGAHVAYEVACELAMLGRPPAALVVAGARAPGRNAGRDLSELADDELIAELCTLGGAPAAVWRHATLVKRLLPGLRADLTALERHVPAAHPPLQTPLLVLAGDRDPLVPLADALAWTATAATARSVVLPAGHFVLNDARAAAAAAVNRHLDACLPRARLETAGS
jgi:pyochelin biosynthetic protein PchC